MPTGVAVHARRRRGRLRRLRRTPRPPLRCRRQPGAVVGRAGKRPRASSALLHNVGVDGRGRVFVCDREADRIQIFDGEGGFIEEWTDLAGPSDLWIGDVVYVVEQLGRPGVSIWTLDGELVTRWSGDSGPANGVFTSSHGVCVDAQGSIYVTELRPRHGGQAAARVEAFLSSLPSREGARGRGKPPRAAGIPPNYPLSTIHYPLPSPAFGRSAAGR